MASDLAFRVRERADSGQLAADTVITVRVTGGAPTEYVEEQISVTGSGVARARSKTVPADRETMLDAVETRALFRNVGVGFDSLIPRARARFVPDSLVGEMTIQVGNEWETLYFLVDPRQRASQKKPVSQEIVDVMRTIETVVRRVDIRRE